MQSRVNGAKSRQAGPSDVRHCDRKYKGFREAGALHERADSIACFQVTIGLAEDAGPIVCGSIAWDSWLGWLVNQILPLEWTLFLF
jgi:hypothetical protein